MQSEGTYTLEQVLETDRAAREQVLAYCRGNRE
jgi:hypothetical protein